MAAGRYRRSGSARRAQVWSLAVARESWVSCFGVYMAVLTSKYPEMTRQLLAYQTLIVREARRCGGNGWLAYDTYFRQQVAGDPSADWSSLNTSLYAVTVLAQGGRGGQSCTTCMESDHSQHECAISHQRSKSPAPKKHGLFTPSHLISEDI